MNTELFIAIVDTVYMISYSLLAVAGVVVAIKIHNLDKHLNK